MTPSSLDDAWEDLLRLIEHRELSPAEIEKRLRARGHTSRSTGEAVRKARRLGLLDEKRLAGAIAVAEAEGAARGILRVKADLERRQIGATAAEKAVAVVDDAARCRSAADRYIAKRGRPESPKEFLRLAAWLARRGHTEESIEGTLADLGMEWPGI